MEARESVLALGDLEDRIDWPAAGFHRRADDAEHCLPARRSVVNGFHIWYPPRVTVTERLGAAGMRRNVKVPGVVPLAW